MQYTQFDGLFKIPYLKYADVKMQMKKWSDFIVVSPFKVQI